MAFVRKLSDVIYSIERVLIAVIMSLMLIVVILGVVFRYVLKTPLVWSEEYAIFALLWLTFLGGSMTIKKNKAASITLFMDKLPAKARKLLLRLSFLLCLLFCAFALYLALQWITNPITLSHKSATTSLPMFIPYMAIPIGFACMIIHFANLLFMGEPNQSSEETL